MSEKHLPKLLLVAIAALLLPLLAHVYLGQYNRALADDFCFTARARDLGIAGTLDWWYNNWTGTYSSTFFQSITGLSRAWQFIPSVLMTIWFVAAIWTAYQCAALLQLRQRSLVALLLGALIVYAANDGTANVFQSLYWTSGAITYSVPVIVLTFNLGVMLFALRKESTQLLFLALIGGLCMLAGGFSPLFGAFQASLFTLATIGSFFFTPKSWRRTAVTLSGTALLFAVISFAILLIAPGNVIRRAEFEAPLPLLRMVGLTLSASFGFPLISVGFLSPMAIITPLILGGMIGLRYQPLDMRQRSSISRNRWRLIGVVALIGFILITACFFAGVYAISDLPPARAYIVPQFALVVTTTAVGYIAGMSLQRNFSDRQHPLMALVGVGVVILVLLLGPVNAARETLNLSPEFRTFAEEWEIRDAALRRAAEAGITPVEITPFTVDLADYAEVRSIEDDPNQECFKSYYGIQELRMAFDTAQ